MKSIASFRPKGLPAALVVATLGVFASASFAQSPAQPAQPAQSPGMTSPTNPSAPMIVPPGKSEAPDSAFKKLDPSAKGYVSKGDTAQLPGFDAAFQRADADKDGKLSASEFNQAWSIYSGTAK